MKFLTGLTLAASVFAAELQDKGMEIANGYDFTGMFDYLDKMDGQDNVVQKKTWDAYIDGVETWDNTKYWIKSNFESTDDPKSDEDIKAILVKWYNNSGSGEDYFAARLTEILEPFKEAQQQAQQNQKTSVSIDLASAREDLTGLVQNKDDQLKILKQVEDKMAAMITKLTETEADYRSSATKAQADAAAKKIEAGKSKEAASQQDTEAGKLTDVATKYTEVAEGLNAQAKDAQTKVASIKTLLGNTENQEATQEALGELISLFEA